LPDLENDPGSAIHGNTLCRIDRDEKLPKISYSSVEKSSARPSRTLDALAMATQIIDTSVAARVSLARFSLDANSRYRNPVH